MGKHEKSQNSLFIPVFDRVPDLVEDAFFRFFHNRSLAGGVFFGQFLEQLGLPGIEIPGMTTLTSTSRSPWRWPLG